MGQNDARTHDLETQPGSSASQSVDPMARLDRRGFIRTAAAGALLASGLGSVAAACGAGNGSPQTSAETAPSNAEPTEAATGSAASPPLTPTGVVRAANTDPAITTLDPTRQIYNTEFPISRNLYDSLYEFSDTSDLVPSLATSHQVSDDGLEWIFELRDGVKFHDGEDFDSTAVRKSIEFYHASDGFLKSMLPPKFLEIDDSDPSVIRLVTPTPYPDLVRNGVWVKIMSPRLLAQGPEAVAATAVGTGPFKFARWDKGRSVTLEANSAFWGDGPHVEQLQYLFLPDQSARLNALRAGQLDMFHQLPLQLVETFAADPRFAVSVPKASWATLELWFETQKPPTDDPRVRQAVAYAINYQEILDSIVFGNGLIPDSIMPSSVYGQTASTPKLAYEPDTARALLREAGYADGVNLAIAALPQSPYPELAQAVAGHLKDVGVTAEVDVLDNAVFDEDRALEDDRAKHHLYSTADIWFNGGPILISAGFYGATDYAGIATSLVPDLNSTPDGPERLAILKEIQNDYAANVPVLNVVNHLLVDAHRADLKGFQSNPNNVAAYFGNVYYEA